MDQDDLPRRLRAWARTQHAALPGPATAEQVAAAEGRIGFPLPPLLRRLYREVANGGFGPDTWELVPLAELRPTWPGRMVTVMDVGCAMASVVDCSDAAGQVLLMDPNAYAMDDPRAWSLDAPTLAQWLEAWIDGTSWLCEQDDVDIDDIPWPVPWPDAAARLAAGPR